MAVLSPIIAITIKEKIVAKKVVTEMALIKLKIKKRSYSKSFPFRLKTKRPYNKGFYLGLRSR